MNKSIKPFGILLFCLVCIATTACEDSNIPADAQPETTLGTSAQDTSGQPTPTPPSTPTLPDSSTQTEAPETQPDPPTQPDEPGTPPVPTATAPWLTFDYTSLNTYKNNALSFTVAAMPSYLLAMLDSCLYRGQRGTGDYGTGWYLNSTEANRTNTAAQAFFTAMAEYVNTECGTDDFCKIKMLHDWIIDYLDYNFSMQYYTQNPSPANSQSATDVLRRGINFNNSRSGSAVCFGYSNLFRAFAEKLVLLENTITRWWVISGWAGDPFNSCCGSYYAAYRSTDGVPTNHAWNQIEINGNVYNVDCTWDDPNCGSSTQNTMTTLVPLHTYLFISPFDMIRDHIPKYKSSQLLDNDNVAPWDDTIMTWEQYEVQFQQP